MEKKIKIKIDKSKSRIPVPQKPPKVEEGKKKYNRRKVKLDTKEQIETKGH
ncbi:MAG: hypothetical protein ACM3UR_09445 [Bacteroidota bacterium]|jgi:hypothetical protein|nr:hypothetical protein [Ignavibacteria bacterium]HEX2962897.1 hypothetical protein [Ignavibacteriales bacterium]MCU7498922.1 hypothetical protein [Ignavibacteria bacterium]MCU7513937.1 hypothetical protein [Ignavibacteria bacterium]MCU7521367.1 hypothetical protein [Ignavibacteria bacterium]